MIQASIRAQIPISNRMFVTLDQFARFFHFLDAQLLFPLLSLASFFMHVYLHLAFLQIFPPTLKKQGLSKTNLATPYNLLMIQEIFIQSTTNQKQQEKFGGSVAIVETTEIHLISNLVQMLLHRDLLLLVGLVDIITKGLEYQVKSLIRFVDFFSRKC